MPSLLSVNVGVPRSVEWRGRLVSTAIWKDPVAGPVDVRGVNLVGDDQADRRVHGGVDKAVYAYAVEDYDWWSATTGPLGPGTFGENLTTIGLDLAACRIGDRWMVGSCVLEVAQPRQPCFKLGIRMDDDTFPGRFTEAGRPGAYLRVVVAGTVEAGAPIEVVPAEQPALTLAEVAAEEKDVSILERLRDDERVPDGWRRSAARALERDRA